MIDPSTTREAMLMMKKMGGELQMRYTYETSNDAWIPSTFKDADLEKFIAAIERSPSLYYRVAFR